MIKKIIHLGDLHIRTYKRHDEYRVVLTDFLNEIKKLLNDYSPEELRIAVTGDIVHQKVTTSNELTMFVAWFLRECADICPVIMIAGNHDLLVDNQDRLDSLTPIVEIMNNPNIHYYKESGCYVDDNIVWAIYSVFEKNQPPDDVLTIKKEHPDKTIVGLFHAPIIGSKTALGYEFTDSGVHPDYFEGCDMVLLGDIHLRNSFMNKFGAPMCFSGSCLQQDFGELITGHGYLIWDVKNRSYTEHDILTDFGFYQFKITSLDDLDTGSEELMNK